MSFSFIAKMLQTLSNKISTENYELTANSYLAQLGLLTIGNFTPSTQTPTSTLVTREASYDEVCDIRKINSLENVSFTVFMVVILIACIVGNGLVILATVVSNKLRQRVTVYFIVSLAFSDLLFGIMFIPFLISIKIYQAFCIGYGSCVVFYMFDTFFNVASILNLLLIAVDRFIAINLPFKYLELLSFKRVKILIACVWIFAALWAIAGMFSWELNNRTSTLSIQFKQFSCSNPNFIFYETTYYAIYLTSLAAMTFLYLKILHVAIQQIRHIEATTAVLQESHNSVTSTRSLNDQRESIESIQQDFSNVPKNNHAKKRSAQRKRRRELKATKSVAIVYFAYVVCWFPNLVINLILSRDSLYFFRLNAANPALYRFIYYTFAQILPLINIMSNPIIYSFSNKQFRKAFKTVIRKMTGRYSSSDQFLSPNRRNTRGISLSATTTTTVTSSASEFSVVSAAHSVRSDKKLKVPSNNEYEANKPNVNNNKVHCRVSFDDAPSKDGTVVWKPD